MLIKIETLDLSCQTRCGTDAETIDNYAGKMAEGEEFPPVTVFTDGATNWLADGFHRVMAAKQNGRATIQADVRNGTIDDAIVYGGTANNKQGKRPTRADQRHFMEMVWERREAIFGGTPTGGNFAKKCGVSMQAGVNFVNAELAEMPVAPEPPTLHNVKLPTAPKMPTRPTHLVGANGKKYPVRPTRQTAETPERPRYYDSKGGEHVVPVDRYDVEIPTNIRDAFGEDLLSDVVSAISSARCAIRKAKADGIVQFAAVRQEALIQLDNAYNFVSAARPHCVCRMCQGNGCKACHLRGWQTEDEYNANPREFKAE